MSPRLAITHILRSRPLYILTAYAVRPILIPNSLPSIAHQILSTRYNYRTMSSAIPKTQTAVQIEEYGGPEIVRVKKDVPVPEVKPTELLVKNEYAGVNFIDTVRSIISCPVPYSPPSKSMF